MDIPTVVVQDPVVMWAQTHTIGQVGRPSVGPTGSGVVDDGPARRPVLPHRYAPLVGVPPFRERRILGLVR